MQDLQYTRVNDDLIHARMIPSLYLVDCEDRCNAEDDVLNGIR